MFRFWPAVALVRLPSNLWQTFLSVSRAGVELGLAGIGLLPTMDHGARDERAARRREWAENEFAFDRAIEAYEALIDETVRGDE